MYVRNSRKANVYEDSNIRLRGKLRRKGKLTK